MKIKIEETFDARYKLWCPEILDNLCKEIEDKNSYVIVSYKRDNDKIFNLLTRHSPDNRNKCDIEKILLSFRITYNKLSELSNGKLISLFSGNGSYIHLNPRFGYPKPDLSIEKKVIGFETLVKGFNNYLFKIESEFYKNYPEYRNFVELDKINNRNRQIKAPLSIHKSFDYIVYPIPESFEIPLIKYHEINDNEIIKARELLNKFKNNEPNTNEIKQFNKTLKISQ